MASERVILSNGGVCNVDTSDHYPGALHVTINGGATLTPPECDALIAAIGRALGRPTPTSTPLEERIANAATDALAGFGKDTDKDDWTWANGCEAGLRAALAMVREQGTTVPRAGVEALRARLLAVDSGMEDIIIDAFDALLAAPTTQTEKG